MDSYKLNGEVKYAISGDMTEFEDILIDKGITTKENILLNKGVNPNDVCFIGILSKLCACVYYYYP